MDSLSYGSFVAKKTKFDPGYSDEAYDWEKPFKNKADEQDKILKEKQQLKAEKDAARRSYIGAKLVGIISCMIIISLGLITVLVSYFVSADALINAEDNNMTINTRTAADCETRISSIVSAAGMFFDQLDTSGKNETQNRENSVRFFERNKDIAGISFLSSGRTYTNAYFFAYHEIKPSLFKEYITQESAERQTSGSANIKLDNCSPFFNVPMISIYCTLVSNNRTENVLLCFSSEQLNENFSSGAINQSFMVNDEGIVLVHPDIICMMSAMDMNDTYLVKEMIHSQSDNKQITYKNSDGVEYIGAYKKLSNGNCSVITEVEMRIILEAVNSTTKRNIYLTVAILSIAICIVWFFSKSISSPMEKLTAISNEINQGNFNTSLFDDIVRVRRHDEIGVLMRSTLAERDILNTVSRLTNKGVARAIVRKEIDFDPHLKDITIFFSDIRGFTAISDGFKKRFGEQSSAEIIQFLNDYMSRMVNCISITGGTPDKFEGDAIMACWGVLRDESLEFEELEDGDPGKEYLKMRHEVHRRDDAINAIRATVAMRYALMKYNKDAEIFTKEHANDPLAKYKPHIRIGCGLNSGRATVGFMGSMHKMEFTSIGDAVNLASRTESSNKPCGTDILLTEDTYNLIKMDYIRCPENKYTISEENSALEIIVEQIPVAFEVKGKGKQHFYGVVNMPQFNITEFFRTNEPDFVLDEDCECAVGPKGPKSLNDVRKLLGIETPDFEKVNLDEEENKVKAT